MVLLILLLALSLYSMLPSFQLGLFGDDWIAIWRYFYAIGPKDFGIWSYFTHLLTAYGSFNLLMGLLVQVVGYKSVYFYLTAYIFRLIAALSFYPLTFYLTRNKLSALFAVLFFSVTAVGLDTTTWVFNMPVYLFIASFNLFLIFFIKSRIEKNYKFFAISLFFFSLSIVLASVRMTGVVPMVILLELFWLIRDHHFESIKLSGIRILIFLSIFYFFVLLGQFIASIGSYTDLLVSSPTYWSGLVSEGLVSARSLLNQGKLGFIFNPLIIIGNMVLPINANSENRLILLFIGGLILSFGIWSLLVNSKNYIVSTGIFLSLAWLILSFMISWIRDPITLLPFHHRYLSVSVVGLDILLAILISRGRNLSQRLLFALFFILIIINIFSSRNYLRDVVNNLHGAQISEKIWSKMPYIPDIGRTASPLVFLFTGDDGALLYGTITFGFPYHMALLYNLDNYFKMPIALGSFEQVKSAVTDGKSLAQFQHPVKPVPIESIYAFHLEGRDNLINKTEEVRQKLREVE